VAGAFHSSATTDGCAGDAALIDLKDSLARLEYIPPILVAWATNLIGGFGEIRLELYRSSIFSRDQLFAKLAGFLKGLLE